MNESCCRDNFQACGYGFKAFNDIEFQRNFHSSYIQYHANGLQFLKLSFAYQNFIRCHLILLFSFACKMSHFIKMTWQNHEHIHHIIFEFLILSRNYHLFVLFNERFYDCMHFAKKNIKITVKMYLNDCWIHVYCTHSKGEI